MGRCGEQCQGLLQLLQRLFLTSLLIENVAPNEIAATIHILHT